MQVFLFTDIEGSTEKWEKYQDEMGKVLSRHDAILKEEIGQYGGEIIKHTGDGIFAVFKDGDPLTCAIEIQKRLEEEEWGVIGELRVRIGLHGGTAEKRGKDYFGPVVNRTARVMAVGWGGQIILTPEVKITVKLPEGAQLKDFGPHLLKDLYEPQQIYGLIHPDLALQEFPSLRSLSSHHHNLPMQTTPFLGRESELKEIIKLLENPSCRLITLIGPGGIGKTRLALQAAAEQIEQFTHGVYFIPLDPLSSANLLVSTIAGALKFSFYSREDEKVQLLNYLREKEMLMILDNFEHLVEGAGIIAEILNKAPNIKIFVTSRQLLNLRGEWIVQVEGMQVPELNRIDVGGYSAVQLFLFNAQRINSNVTFSDEDKRYVVRICQLVGGLPLGIEIASSWLRSLSCKEIAQEIEKSIDFLASSLRDMPDRHRSLRAVFDYSWDLLSKEEKNTFMKMSVFRESFTREAAEKVAGISLPVLTALMDKSLIRRNPSGRYEMQDIIRQYAEGKINEFAEEKQRLKDSHCSYYADFMSQMEKVISEGKEEEVFDEIREESKNIQSAWDWAVERCKIKEIGKAVISFAVFYDMHGWFREGMRLFSNTAEVLQGKAEESEDRVVYGKVLSWYGNFCYRLGEYDKAKKLLKESIEIFRKFGAKRGISFSLHCLGRLNAVLGNYEEAKKFSSESLQINKEIGDRIGIANSLNAMGVINYYLAEYSKAKQFYQESLDISKETGYQKGIGVAECNIGLVAHALGNYEEAIRLLEKGIKMDREMENKLGLANTVHNLGLTYKALGDYEKAKKHYEEALAIRREIGDRMGIAISLNNLGNLGGRTVDYEEAKRFHQESLDIRREIGDKMGVAQSLNNMASVFTATGEHKKAKEYFNEALMVAVDSKEKTIIQESLLGIADYLILDGKKERSLEILSFLQNYGKDDEDLQKRVKDDIGKIKSDFSSQEINDIKKRVENKKLEDMVGDIIGQLMDIG